MQRRGKNDNELRHYDHSIHGHELDWLAFNLSCDDCSKARYSQDSEPGSEPQLHRGYSFQVTGKALAAFEIDGKAAGDDDEKEPNGDDYFERASFGSYEPVVEDPDKTWDIMSGQYCCFAGPGDGNPYDAAAKRPAEDFRGYETDGHADSQQECTSEAGAPVESLAGSEDGSEAIAQRGRISDIETPTGEEAHNGSQSNEISGAEQALPVDKKLRVSVEKMGEHTVAKGSKPNHAVPDPKAVFETRVRLANLTGNVPTSICQLGLDQHQSWDPELVRSRHKAGQIARAVCDAAAVLFSDARQRKSLRLQVGIGELGGGSSRAHQIVSVDLEKPSGSTSMGWSIDTAAIEALLGLWLWSIIEPTSYLPESHRAMGYNEVNLPSRSARIVSTGDGEEHWCRRTYVEGELRLLLGSNAPKLQTAKARIDPESDYGLVAMWPAAETKAGGAAVWQKVMPPDSRPPQGKRFFGWQRADSPLRKPEVEEDRAYSIQYVDTDASVLDICAQEIYAALITSMASSQNCSALNLTLHGRGTERQLASDSFTTLRTAFVEQGLGTTADAVLCLLSALREKLRIRPSEENVADIVRECLETRDYRQMEAPLRWACLSFEEEHLNRVIRATAEMYRGAMRKNPDFGIEGILWLASKGPSSLRGEGGMLTVYEAAVKQFREQGRGRLWSGELLKAIRGSPSSWSTPPPDDHGLAALYLLCGYRTIPYVDTFNYDAQRDLGKCLETALWKALKRPSSVWSSIALAVAQVAIKTGLVQTLSTLIFQRTMLCSAVELGDYDLVNLFLENGANNGVQSDDNKEKALLPAARREDTLMIHLLLPFGEDKEKEVLAYKQLLFASAEDGDVDGLRTAIAAYKHRNLDLDEKNQNGQTALSLAAKNGNPGCVTELLSLNTKGPILVNPTSQDNTQLTPMLWAAKSCPRFETDEEILGRRWENTSEPGYLEYNRAAYEEREAQYHDVVDAIYRAYGSEGSHEIFDSQQRTPLSWAAFNGSARLTRWICTMYEVDPNALDIRSRTPLSLAVENKHTHIVEFLLGQEACKPNLPDSRGQTPLHLAIANGSKDIVRILLERWDVDPNLRDLEGTTPLGLAASNGWSEYAEMLLARKDVMASRTDSFGRTPLILAAQNNKKEVVELLLQHYSEEGLNVQDNLGWTALCYAIYLGYGEIVKMLVRDERVFVPEPGTGKWDGGNLCGFAPGKTLKLLVKLGVWQTGEEDDGVQYWEKLEVRQPIAETESDGDDSEFEVEAEDTGEYEATTADDADPEAGIEFGEDGKFEVEEAVGDAELGDGAGEGFQPEDGAADDSEPVFNDESAQSEA
jgi:ankyrin repeat protein